MRCLPFCSEKTPTLPTPTQMRTICPERLRSAAPAYRHMYSETNAAPDDYLGMGLTVTLR